jgi:hypothetical protein
MQEFGIENEIERVTYLTLGEPRIDSNLTAPLVL